MRRNFIFPLNARPEREGGERFFRTPGRDHHHKSSIRGRVLQGTVALPMCCKSIYPSVLRLLSRNMASAPPHAEL